jgi:Tfp pilus assembly pilus retraction ATPase PilT
MRMAASPQRQTLIHMLLHTARLLEASDLYLDVGEVPRFRIRGDTTRVDCRLMTQDDLAGAVSVIVDSEQLECLERGTTLIVPYTCPEGVAYRVSVSNKKGRFSLWAQRLRGSVDAALCLSATAPGEPEASPDRRGSTALQSPRLLCPAGR